MCSPRFMGAASLSATRRLRHPVVKKVVEQIRRAMAVPQAHTPQGRLVRAAPFLVSAVVPVVRRPVQRWILGLDHELGL
jgi:hypothetical protein